MLSQKISKTFDVGDGREITIETGRLARPSFGFSVAQTVARIIQLPLRTVTDPSAWRARRPVSIVISRPSPTSKVLLIFEITFFKFGVEVWSLRLLAANIQTKCSSMKLRKTTIRKAKSPSGVGRVSGKYYCYFSDT